jgi:hypothetical protein
MGKLYILLGEGVSIRVQGLNLNKKMRRKTRAQVLIILNKINNYK